MNSFNWMKENNKKLKYRKDFERIFKLDFDEFFDPITGFDICGFDDVLQPPDGTSLEELVKEKFGEEGRILIKNLL